MRYTVKKYVEHRAAYEIISEKGEVLFLGGYRNISEDTSVEIINPLFWSDCETIVPDKYSTITFLGIYIPD